MDATAKNVVLALARGIRLCDHLGDAMDDIEHMAKVVGLALPEDWRDAAFNGDAWGAWAESVSDGGVEPDVWDMDPTESKP